MSGRPVFLQLRLAGAPNEPLPFFLEAEDANGLSVDLTKAGELVDLPNGEFLIRFDLRRAADLIEGYQAAQAQAVRA